ERLEAARPVVSLQTLRPILEEWLDMAGRSLRFARRAAHLLPDVVEMVPAPADLAARLESSTRRLEHLRARVARLWEWLNARSPRDQGMAAESLAAYERGEVEDVADVIERLESGGSLVPE